MSKFNEKKLNSSTINLAGGNAYKMNPEMELVNAVLTTFLEDKYYESGNDRLIRIQELVKRNQPQFVANLAIVARNEFNLRSVTTVLLGELAKVNKGAGNVTEGEFVTDPKTGKSYRLGLVAKAIMACAVRPDDLIELVAYLGKPLPKQVKRGVRNAFLKFSPYQIAKYKNEDKAWSELGAVIKMCHPKVYLAEDNKANAWDLLRKGELKSFDTWEAELSKNPTAETWERLISENKIGYMAMLRNLNNLDKYKVGEDTMAKVYEFLTDPEKVKRSRQLPFRFFTAYVNTTGSNKVKNAIAKAMDIAVANTPELTGKTLIAVDTSGSMNSGYGKEYERPIAKASIFAATLLKANPDADVVLYDTDIEDFRTETMSPVITIAQKIVDNARGGGTMTSLVFKNALKKKKVYDRIIILSDNESWAESYYDDGVNTSYNAYKNGLGIDPYVYAIDIAGHGTKDIEGGKVMHLTGWADRLLDFIGKSEQGETLVKYIRGYNAQTKSEETEE